MRDLVRSRGLGDVYKRQMFDPQGEIAFIEECQSVLAQRTVILITHRPASLALADRVLRLDKGCVAPDVRRNP